MATCRNRPPACAIRDVLPHLDGVKAAALDNDQYYARCPAHDDHRASMSFRPGQHVRFVWHCEADCAEWEVRAAMVARGVPESCLGIYGVAQRRRAEEGAAARLREIASVVTGAGPWDAYAQMRIMAIIEGGEIPKDQAGFLALATRAGVGRARRYQIWAKYGHP